MPKYTLQLDLLEGACPAGSLEDLIEAVESNLAVLQDLSNSDAELVELVDTELNLTVGTDDDYLAGTYMMELQEETEEDDELEGEDIDMNFDDEECNDEETCFDEDSEDFNDENTEDAERCNCEYCCVDDEDEEDED